MEALFNSTNQWLRDSLQMVGYSANALSRQLRVDAAQISRWVNGREKLPRRHLLEIAEILCPADLDYAENLKSCEEIDEQVQIAAEVLSADQPALAKFIISRVYAKLASVLSEELDTTPKQHANLGARFLTATLFALRCAIALRESPQQNLVTIENVHRHLRYPYNHFVGLMMDLTNDPESPPDWQEVLADFRNAALRSLRQTASPSPREWSGAERFIRHHSLHLLARHGETQDRELVARQLLQDQKSDDLMARRLSLAGLSLAGFDSDIGQRYLAEIRTDDVMRMTNIAFDAIHYGDLTPAETSRPITSLRPPKLAVRHVLRHILHLEHYVTIQRVEEQTLCDIFALFGEPAFRSVTVAAHLHECIESGVSHLFSDQFRETAINICNRLDQGPRLSPINPKCDKETQ